MTTLRGLMEDSARASADPTASRVTLERLAGDEAAAALLADPATAAGAACVAGASRSLARLLVAGGAAALAEVTAAAEPPELAGVLDAADVEELERRKRLSYLRIATADLTGLHGLEQVTESLSDLADAVLEAALRLAGAEGLAVVAMGKHGARELNYASDVDILFVSEDGSAPAAAAARRAIEVASRCYRIDVDLRPEGRSGSLARSLGSYRAYWEKWASPWEFQALLKSRAAAGDTELGKAFEEAVAETLWSRPFDSEALVELRSMKRRSEQLVARRGLLERELKLGPGGIRDIEFAAQLLQLVHGGADPALRARSTLGALAELGGAGYVDSSDASSLSIAYRFLRTVEHRLQLVDEARVHAVPPAGPARDRLARVLGFQPKGTAPRARSERFDEVLAWYQSSVRSIHERLYFRPLLEVFSVPGRRPRLPDPAFAARLAAFGFADAERTRRALDELTRGLTRSSRLMQQLLPVLLGWLSETPDPELGLLGLRNLAGLAHQRDVVVAAFRDSPELARRLCVVLGTSRRLGELVQRHPSDALSVAEEDSGRFDRLRLAQRALAAAEQAERAAAGIRRVVGAETLRIAAAELLSDEEAAETPRRLSALGDAVLAAALESVAPRLPFGIVAMGSLGGDELSYGSDLDVLLVYEGSGAADAAEAERAAAALLHLLNGATPAESVWTVDPSLRPEGRGGALARSLDAYAEYHERWISAWERQALLRARPVAGSAEVLARFTSISGRTLWERPFVEQDARETRRLKARMERERIPAAEDPQFHLKLGRGSLADIEWTVQLLQLEHRVSGTSTSGALAALEAAGALARADALALADALAFLVATRNRWHLVGNFVAAAGGLASHAGADSLPQSKQALTRLARSLGTSPTELRERYRRVTRRARKVVERRFYGLEDGQSAARPGR